MRDSKVESVRLPLYWTEIEPQEAFITEANWGGFDHEVELAAEAEIRVMPFVFGTPDWVAPESVDLPVRTAWQRNAWAHFLRAAAHRYGPEGEFWEEHPKTCPSCRSTAGRSGTRRTSSPSRPGRTRPPSRS